MNNPDACTYECLDCGRTTKVNRRTGRVYSHQIPGGIRVCLASGTLALPVQDGNPPELPPLRSNTTSVSQPKPVADGPSTSVRTVRGGLPSLGRRR